MLSRPYPGGGTAPAPASDTEDEMCESVRDQKTATESEGMPPYLVSGIVFPHLRKILFEDLLVEGRLAHVYDLRWSTMLAVREFRATRIVTRPERT